MKKKLVSVILAGAMVLSLIGCGQAAETTTTDDKAATEETTEKTTEAAKEETDKTDTEKTKDAGDMTLGISMCAIESQMWAEYQQSMHDACDAAGVKYTEVIAENDVQKQNQQIENLISSGCDAIIIAPADGDAVVSAIQKCNDAGIPVIMANRAAGEGAKVAATVSSDNVAMVEREMNYVLEKAKADGTKYKVLELVGSLTDVNAIARQTGFKNVADANPDVFEVVSEVPTEWKGELALSGVLNSFEANPDINMIFSPSDALLPSIMSGLQQINKWTKVGEDGHVTFITFDGAADAINQIKEGYVDIVSVQDATKQGQLCVQAAIDSAGGETNLAAEDYTDPGFEVSVDNIATSDFAGY